MLLSVLSIIGAVLKWVLFVVLGIVALVLLLLIIVLSSSVTYRAEGSKEDKKLQLAAKVGYLLSLVRVTVDLKDKKLSWKAMAAWKQVAGSDQGSKAEAPTDSSDKHFSHGDLKVETLTSVEQGEVKNDSTAEMTMEAASETAAETPIETPAVTSAVSSDETTAATSAATSAGTSAEALEDPSQTKRGEEASEKTSEVSDKNLLQRLEDKGKDAVRSWRDRQKEQKRLKEEKAAQKAAEKARKEQEKEEKRKARAEAKQAKQQKLADLPDTILDVVDAILDAPDKIEDIIDEKIVPKYEKFEKYYRLFDKYPRKRETLLAILQLVVDILKHLVPKRYEVMIDYGSDDPYKAAKMLGRFYAFSPLLLPRQNKHHRLELTADMENKKFDFDGAIRGRFSINSLLVFPVLKALFNRDIQRLIRFVLKLRKKKKKEAKTVPNT